LKYKIFPKKEKEKSLSARLGGKNFLA